MEKEVKWRNVRDELPPLTDNTEGSLKSDLVLVLTKVGHINVSFLSYSKAADGRNYPGLFTASTVSADVVAWSYIPPVNGGLRDLLNFDGGKRTRSYGL